MGYEIAMPKSLSEQENLVTFLNSQPALKTSSRLWIGFTGSQTAGFLWNDREQLSWTNWWRNQPNSGSLSSCGELVGPEWTWNDNECHVEKHFVCKKVKGNNGSMVY